MHRFKDQTVVITRDNQDIGYAIAERFASEGTHVVMASIDAQVTAAAVICGIGRLVDVKALNDAAGMAFGSNDLWVQTVEVYHHRHGQRPDKARNRQARTADQHRLWSGPLQVYPDSALCRPEIWRGWLDPKSGKSGGRGQDHLTANAICPGIPKTDMWDQNDQVWRKYRALLRPER